MIISLNNDKIRNVASLDASTFILEEIKVSTLSIVLIVIAAVLLVAVIVLYFVGKKAQKKQEEQQEQINATKQTVSMLIIDKKRMKIKDSGLPQMVIDQTPKLMRRQKMPIVKAKVGPRIMTLVADANVFDVIPVKKEVKATVSGIYITDVRGVRGPLEQPPKKKKGFLAKIRSKAESSVNATQTTDKKSKKK